MLQRHLTRFPLHKESDMAMTSEPSRRAYEGTSLFVKPLDDMPFSEELWNCCRWENGLEDENGMVIKTLSRGQPILLKNGAMNSRGLKLPVFPLRTSSTQLSSRCSPWLILQRSLLQSHHDHHMTNR